MNRELTGWIIAAAIAGAWWFSPKQIRPKYDFHNAAPLIFLIENDTGKVWRFYRSMSNGVITSEGFSRLPMQ